MRRASTGLGIIPVRKGKKKKKNKVSETIIMNGLFSRGQRELSPWGFLIGNPILGIWVPEAWKLGMYCVGDVRTGM